ncbi:hypothetical protein MAR_017405, partial [Mya arenaria]
MNKIFKKSRSVSPSFEIPKICLPRQAECIDDGYDIELNKGLKVPQESRGRSTSFDSSSLQRQNTLTKKTLEVPGKNSRRCHSLDSTCTYQMSPSTSDESISDSRVSGGTSNFSLKVPKFQGRRSSLDIPKLCIHCVHMEAKAQENREREEALLVYNQDRNNAEDSDNISFTSSTSYTSSLADSLSDPSGFYYLSDSEDEGNESDCEDNLDSPNFRNNTNSESFDSYHGTTTKPGKSSHKQVQRQKSFDNGDNLPVPMQIRSSSVDVNLPTEQDSRYKAIPHSHS